MYVYLFYILELHAIRSIIKMKNSEKRKKTKEIITKVDVENV